MVLFSGGQDSTTCLAWALSKFERVETLGFDYGQRHAVELECRKTVLEKLRRFKPDWERRLGEDHMLDMGLLGQISDCALTREQELRFMENNIPNTFVPARNLLFLRLRLRLPIGAAFPRWWAACAKPTTPDMRIAVTIR